MEDLIEDPRPAPAHEAVVQRLVWTIGRWRIFPSQAVPDAVDDPADHPPIINMWNAVRDGEIRFDPVRLLPGQQKHFTHGHLPARVNHISFPEGRRKLNES